MACFYVTNQASGYQSVTGAIHYDITMVNDVARDTHCDITMVMMSLGTSTVISQWVMILLGVHIMASQCIMMLLWTSFIMYYYAYLYYFIMGSKESQSNNVILYCNLKQFL